MSRSVQAIVLTHNAPAALLTCVARIASQVEPPATILITDNASTPAAAETLRGRQERCPIEVLRLDENLGPAGGYAAALRAFLASEHDWAWILDDDCAPAPDALARLLARAREEPNPAVIMSTIIDDDTGATINTQGWCSVLIPRSIVTAVGVPDADLFWWAEDTEFLQWRIPRSGFAVRRSLEAVVRVPRARGPQGKPGWKYYYEARNQVYYRLYVQRPPSSGDTPPHLRLRVRTYRALRSVLRLSSRALVTDASPSLRKLAMVLSGTADGLRGRLGRPILPDCPDRPWSTQLDPLSAEPKLHKGEQK